MRYTIVAILILFIVLFFFPGCSGHCLKIGGTYKEVSGEIEYCFNQEKSAKNGVPTLESDKNTLYGLTQEQIQEINAMLENDSSNIVENKTIQVHLREILKKIGEK